MDLFVFYAKHQVLVCKPCAYAVAPLHLVSHIRSLHAHEACRDVGLDFAKFRVQKAAKIIADCLKEKYSLLDPRTYVISRPLPTDPPLPDLKLYRGYQCSRCDYVVSRSKSSGEILEKHFNRQHRILQRKKGRPLKSIAIPEEDKGPIYREVYCQRFFVSSHQSSFFTICVCTQVQKLAKSRPRGHADVLRALVDEQLTAGTCAQDARAKIYNSQVSKTEVSPWLEMTRWPRYFHGLNMADIASLAYAANPITESALVILSESFDRLIECAHQSVCEDKVSVFDQAQINSFIAGRSSKHDRMLMVKLQKSTFRAYKSLWARLLCFVYRTSLPSQSISLLHRFTNSQLFHLDRTICLAKELSSIQRLSGCNVSPSEGEGAKELVRNLDRACLLLCIALLDHTLQGDHFESVILSFLAVLGIDENPGGIFRGPLSYSPDLSKFIKMAQMLVVQRSVVAAEEGEVEHPSYMLDEMRERFMVRGSRTAFDWACRLRAYAKKVVSNTTSLGYITWSEDGSSVTYKDTGFSMDALRKFIAVQIDKAQQELEDLLLLHADEARDDIVPPVYLYRLQDNHSNGQKGWNFLKDQRNAAQLQEGGDRWLLSRVLENDWLRDEMVDMIPESQLRWKKKAVQAYFEKVDKFLERLLLLIHMTGGQPPRGTELIGLQHSNTAQGQHRGIFLEEGLISTITSYHKGYNITGSTKIIHRYLPKEVSELLVYYLWLILPFWQQLDILVYKRKDPHSTFLWPKGSGTWDSSRLTKVISREARLHLDTSLGILTYRHLAIPISRQHLLSGGFKRDYGVDKKLADEQATHGTWIAGTVYARGLQEAPGHVKARSSEYRAVSREWHSFLGFRTYLGARKRPLGEHSDAGSLAKKAR
ncbi:hypothetical protein HBI23_245980 [Parastagonospora nodorum]|nr:hypothetical protein HBI23_245980 [Parastagonospora nodorum]KAH5622350.1 hypothetical protein HBI51_246190 [Parastagonospora nodorum]KAH5983726.1 hypothetical protein HBI84_244710 [Parastagonospora nodorum]KAH6134225.1 hypothetical protein HBI68_247140 [Parastagonospora nodorum]KAH6380593.1 hypothetical protein HBI08_234740 [Parastagonospora nodorum]